MHDQFHVHYLSDALVAIVKAVVFVSIVVAFGILGAVVSIYFGFPPP